jgi:hypothetical protein
MIPATFVSCLVFAFTFFGIWAWKDAASGTPPAAIRPFIVGLLFVLIALVISILVRG